MKRSDFYQPCIQDLIESLKRTDAPEVTISMFEEVRAESEAQQSGSKHGDSFELTMMGSAIYMLLMCRRDFGNVGTYKYLVALRDSMHVESQEDRTLKEALDACL